MVNLINSKTMEEAIDIRNLVEASAKYEEEADERLRVYIREQSNADQKREVLLEVERQIKHIAGEPRGGICFRNFNDDEEDKLDSLLRMRGYILDEMMSAPIPQEVERLRYQNDKLLRLSRELYAKAALLQQMKDHSDIKFDEEYRDEVDGVLLFEYNDDDAVVRLENDGYYGSDFRYMILLIATLVEGNFPNGSSEIARYGTEGLDDGTSWNEGCLGNRAFDGITICHAVHALVCHQPYCVPDLLRMNDFVIRITVEYERDCH